ncbi:MAG: hypothetical protein H0T76_25270 [Nannocystis sp.]|nr:hypothetical protein [Nannocystis sp.]MBA3549805.1 hypothetical protein [Nannocystis sp.]
MLREQDSAAISMIDAEGSGILAPMACFTSLMLTAAMVAAPIPAAAVDPMGALLKAIQQEQDRRQFKRAADLAAPASQRTDLRPADRFLLAGLAAESYGEAFKYGGAPRQPRNAPAYLCAQRAVLQEAIALTKDRQKLNAVDDALGKVAAQLAQVAASGRDVPCALAPVGSEAEPTPPAETPPAETPPAVATETATVTPPAVAPPAVATGRVPTRSPADTRRVWAGIGTLVPGLLLLVPMAAVLAQRGQVERSLRQLQADTMGRALTDGELQRAASLDRQFRGTTTAAAVLGAAGAALAVTGLVLLATRPRRAQVAVAPWGARGVGGLVLEGKF